MQFDYFETMYDIINTPLTREQLYKAVESQEITPDSHVEQNQIRARCENLWYENLRPYYRLYPSIIPVLERTPLDIKLSEVDILQGTCAIYYPNGGGATLVTVNKPHLVVMAQLADRSCGLAVMKYTTAVEKQLDEHAVFTPRLRVALAVLMLAHDPELVQRQILRRDEHKEITQSLINKAIRRGVNCFNVGQDFTVVPHVRRQYFGFRWYGKGKTLKRLVKIKACIVHRQKVVTVPSDHDLTGNCKNTG